MSDLVRPAGRSRTVWAVVLGALTGLGPLATDLYLPSFPELAERFDTTVAVVQLTLATSFLGLAIGQLVYGPVSDALGRRRPLAAGMLLFVATSVACALAPSIETLIALRFVQGLGACAGLVISWAIVRDLFAGAEAARLLSLIMLVFGVAPVIAPLVGGQLLALGGWRSAFIALAVYGLVCLVVALLSPETHRVELRRSGGIADALASYGYLIRTRAFLAYAAAGGLSVAGLLTYISASPAVVIEQYGVSPQAFGIVFGVNSIGLVAVSQVTGRLLGRYGPAAILRVALAVQAGAAAALLVVALADVGGLLALLVPLFVVVSCIGAVMPTSTALALSPFPERAGAASALVGALQLALGAAGGALVGLFGLEPAVSMGIVIAAACGAAAAIYAFAAPRTVPDAAHPAAASQR